MGDQNGGDGAELNDTGRGEEDHLVDVAAGTGQSQEGRNVAEKVVDDVGAAEGQSDDEGHLYGGVEDTPHVGPHHQPQAQPPN